MLTRKLCLLITMTWVLHFESDAHWSVHWCHIPTTICNSKLVKIRELMEDYPLHIMQHGVLHNIPVNCHTVIYVHIYIYIYINTNEIYLIFMDSNTSSRPKTRTDKHRHEAKLLSHHHHFCSLETTYCIPFSVRTCSSSISLAMIMIAVFVP